MVYTSMEVEKWVVLTIKSVIYTKKLYGKFLKSRNSVNREKYKTFLRLFDELNKNLKRTAVLHFWYEENIATIEEI